MNTLNIISRETYTICQMDHGKVNAIDTELSEELTQFFEKAGQDEQVQGVILTGRPHCFSAGLNIMKLAAGGLAGIEQFWRSHISCLQTMIRFPKPFISAITGYAPAAGTTLACTADYRIMGRGEKHVIGMHEMKYSLAIPQILNVIFAHWIGDNKAMECFLHSRLMQADEAQAIGLVNEACEVEDVLPRAEALMQQWTNSYWRSTARSKYYFKKGLIDKIDIDVDRAIAEILESSSDPMVSQKFAEFVMSVKKKKS
ncbi:MAG: enoyl-CoA hydratase/isomerase family protein [Bacteroidota bacterium]